MTNKLISASASVTSLHCHLPTRAMMTIGVAALGVDCVASATKAIEIFDEFYQCHCPTERENVGFIHINKRAVFFQIEYCDDEMRIITQNFLHPRVTQRIVSFFLAVEKCDVVR